MNLKKVSKEFNYLNEEVEITSDQENELRDIMLKHVGYPDVAEEMINDFLYPMFGKELDISLLGNISGDFEDEINAWKKKHNLKEGTCGYSVDGKPASKPAGPHLIRKAIREEIKKLSEMDDGINPKVKSIASNINKAIISIDPDMPYMDFAKGVAQVLIDEYGTHNYEPFIKELKKVLDSTLG